MHQGSTQRRVHRDPERGNSLVLAMIVLTALGTLSMLTVVSVRSGLQTSANDRFHAMAMYAAESGGAAAMVYLRSTLSSSTGWSTLMSPGDATPQAPSGIVGNDVQHGDFGNPFSSDVPAWYHVEIHNNRGDTGYFTGTDDDKRVIIRSSGFGPDGATAVIEWEITGTASSAARPCPGYAQKGLSEDNAGANDCLGVINTGDSGSF